MISKTLNFTVIYLYLYKYMHVKNKKYKKNYKIYDFEINHFSTIKK